MSHLPAATGAHCLPGCGYTTFNEVDRSAEDAYAQACVTDPRAELAVAECHDCFTPTELVLM